MSTDEKNRSCYGWVWIHPSCRSSSFAIRIAYSTSFVVAHETLSPSWVGTMSFVMVQTLPFFFPASTPIVSLLSAVFLLAESKKVWTNSCGRISLRWHCTFFEQGPRSSYDCSFISSSSSFGGFRISCSVNLCSRYRVLVPAFCSLFVVCVEALIF